MTYTEKNISQNADNNIIQVYSTSIILLIFMSDIFFSVYRVCLIREVLHILQKNIYILLCTSPDIGYIRHVVNKILRSINCHLCFLVLKDLHIRHVHTVLYGHINTCLKFWFMSLSLLLHKGTLYMVSVHSKTSCPLK